MNDVVHLNLLLQKQTYDNTCTCSCIYYVEQKLTWRMDYDRYQTDIVAIPIGI